jgi:uncharacterized oligopeptide transporter (OPT) family protein
MIIGGMPRGSSSSTETIAFYSLTVGAVASQAAFQAPDLATDFNVGYFVGTPPRYQFYGQLVGVLSAIFLSPALYIVFYKAYPCIQDISQMATCGLTAPAAQGYRVIFLIMASPELLIP